MKKEIKDFLIKIGRKGGKSRSARKIAAVKANLDKGRKAKWKR